MDGTLHQILPLFEWARSSGTPLVLATVIATRGSTYRKAGAQMLIAPGGRYEGLLSGGCLEHDLAGHAVSVLETGVPKVVQYNLAGDDDLLWGLGAGCDGGMDVWLVRVDPSSSWEPVGTMAGCYEQCRAATYGMVLESSVPALPVGTTIWFEGGSPRPIGLPGPLNTWLNEQLTGDRQVGESRVVELDSPRVRLFVTAVAVPRELLLIGGGPDSLPVVEFAATLGWRVTVADHRPAYAGAARFPRARRVLLTTPADLGRHVDLATFDAAVVMSHHLATDLAALVLLAPSTIPYVGLLGPATRRTRLLSDLGVANAAKFGSRLHAPVGLELGGRDPASIALAIVAEIQAHFHGKGHGQAIDRNTAGSSLHVVLLAAGSSLRFGSPKQLASVAGRPMLLRSLEAVLQLERRHPVTVVLGAHADRLEPLVRSAAVNSITNPDHEQGVASSIRAGLTQTPVDARGVLIALADQVAVTPEDFRRLVAAWERQPDRIVAARYADTVGAPAIFPADLFHELAALQGDSGARSVLSRHQARVVGIPMPSAAHDVDVPADLPVR